MSNSIDKKLTKDFEWVVSVAVGRNYKKGFRWKSKLRWSLTKDWNNRWFKVGIPGMIREQLGEEEATRLFQDISDEIINDTSLLDKAIADYHESNPFA